ncbi:hypothetical protein O9G_006295 [Rozella allomycis CSF55]|uniref:Uncharacterized protein n=1 Tax=Rozella allomycis (strain CSF55) TaxID=988480 RepID=A0A075B3M7_ROZAC|nr:hypothetical protein O9G_006295 [Rozella allomycis CSF55]|eukprot:EPZ35601.1 hypothetical protein O9G_006295 [Rozella allomycis CSF55]
MYSASADCTISLWSIERKSIVKRLEGHKATVKKITINENAPDIVITGARDGDIRVWDMRKSSNDFKMSKSDPCVRVLNDCHRKMEIKKRKRKSLTNANNGSSVTGLTFLKYSYTFASTGLPDQSIKIWDLRKLGKNLQNPINEIKEHEDIFANGLTDLAFNNHSNDLYALSRKGE